MKKGFTIIEMLIVIIIVGLLMVAFKDAFNMDKKEFINSNTCVNYAFGQMKTFLNSAITGRGYYTGNKYEYADKYIMDFDDTNNEINLILSGGVVANTNINKIVFSGGNGTLSKCYSSSYKTTFSGQLSEISINKGLQGTINDDPFSLNNDPQKFTGSVDFYFERYNGDTRILSKIIVDKRVNQLRFSRCMQWKDDMSKCKKWSN